MKILNSVLLLCVLMATALFSRPVVAQQETRKTRVLLITGDWKSQAWYQDVWMEGKGEKLFRGRFIAHEVEKAAPGKFGFTQMTNYEAQQYLDANYLSQFDVVLIGDIVGVSLMPRFYDGIQKFVENGGGLAWVASYKWQITQLKDTPLEAVLPATFPVSSLTGDWKISDSRIPDKDFVPQLADANQPIVAGLDWKSAPPLVTGFQVEPKAGADVLLKAPGGAPILIAGDEGKGRAVVSSSIASNDELSEKFGNDWPDFGKFYAQMFTWLGAHSTRAATPTKPQTAQVALNVDATKSLNPVSAKLFSIHGSHDDPGLAPLAGEALKNFGALNLDGGFSRLGGFANDVEKTNDNDDPNVFNWAAFDFTGIDKQLGEIKRLKLNPIVVFELNYGKPEWLWKGLNSTPAGATPQAIAEVGEMVSAVIEHANGGKGGDPNYKLNVEYVELFNEPEFTPRTIPGLARLFKAVAARVHRDYPGVKIGTYGSYETPYITEWMAEVGNDLDWISRHPYGNTGEAIFQQQDNYTAWRTVHDLKPIEYIVTEWDFWIQGRPKFDYLMRRDFEAVRRANLAGTLHYRLGQYGEPIYMFGVLWTGWGAERGAGAKGTPMHDAYDAFWAWRDFRGARVPVAISSSMQAEQPHLLADAARDGDKINVVCYFDQGYDGTGWTDFSKSIAYTKARVTLDLKVPPVKTARSLTISRTNSENFAVEPTTIPIKAGQTEVKTDLELDPATAVSLLIQ